MSQIHRNQYNNNGYIWNTRLRMSYLMEDYQQMVKIFSKKKHILTNNKDLWIPLEIRLKINQLQQQQLKK